MAWENVEGWSGRVWVAENGKRTFYIRQVREGKRWSVSTRCSTLRAALKELERFEMDPQAYRPLGSTPTLVLNEELIERYAKWCKRHDGRARRRVARGEEALSLLVGGVLRPEAPEHDEALAHTRLLGGPGLAR
jgi:hypothetical protein